MQQQTGAVADWTADAANTVGLAGLCWAAGRSLPDEDVYAGRAGLLRALAEARLSGHREFDEVAVLLRNRLLDAGDAEHGLYVGRAGHVAALTAWAAAAGDEVTDEEATGTRRLGAELAAGPLPATYDVISGQAGLLLVLVALQERAGAERVAEALAALARPAPGGLEWRHTPTATYVMPGLSHGTAGVALALARAAALLGRADLLELARAGARRLLMLGQRADGTVAVPHSVPQHPLVAPQSWGWCHGPTGTVQVFLALAALEPGWDHAVTGSLAALRASGLPERRHPGFWDNVGQCCGTAGVLELALDRAQATGDQQWLDWAHGLAVDLLTRAVEVPDGVVWSNVEHAAADPVLPPEPGWMQGAAGVAAALLRYARVQRDGYHAARVPWPDRV